MSPSQCTKALRLPALPANRAYLKALRQAELAAWEPTQAAPDPASATAAVPRLPVIARDAGESWLYVLLAGICLALLAHETWALLQSAGNWHQFVEYVQRLLAA